MLRFIYIFINLFWLSLNILGTLAGEGLPGQSRQPSQLISSLVIVVHAC
mgnify:CR=1 FL=1